MDDHTTMLPVISVAERLSAEPRRADLPTGRVLLGLALAPLPGAALMTLGIYLASALDDSVRVTDLVILMLSPVVWSVICGFAYLRIIASKRGQIARSECLLLGCVSSLLMPFVYDVSGALLLHGSLLVVDPAHLRQYAIAGLFSLPFGLFGGWVFWRVGVHPAAAPMRDYAPVFD